MAVNVTLFGNRVFADVIKLKIFGFRVSPAFNDWHPYKSKERKIWDKETQRGSPLENTDSHRSDAATSSGTPRAVQSPEARREAWRRFSHTDSERNEP